MRWLSWIVGAIAFLVYAALSPKVAGDKDSGEFMLVLATFGVAHPTGYPLYTLLGGTIVHGLHALGVSWAHAANGLSALCGGVTIGVLHAIGVRLLREPFGESSRGRGNLAAVALWPVAAFALNPLWTVETTLAEVNAGHVAWVAVAALAALHVVSNARRPAFAALSWGLVVGTGLAHHATSMLFSVPLTCAIAYSYLRHGRASSRTALAFAGGTIVPLAGIAWIAWHAWHPADVQWPELGPSWSSVVDHVTGAQYRHLLGHFAPSEVQARELAVDGYAWIALAGGGALAALLSRRDGAERPVQIALGFSVLAQIVYAFSYGVSDPSAYFLPAIAVGLVLFVAWIAGVTSVRAHGRWVATATAVALVFVQFHGVRTAVNRRVVLEQFDGLVRRMWGSLPPGPGVVIWDDDMAWRLVALQRLEGSRRDLEVVQPRHLSYAVPRARFAQRHGFDPVAGLSASDARVLQADARASMERVDAIVDRINRSTDVPVILFLPEIPSLRRLQKPGD